MEAENAVFEDRGNGNLLWTGEVSGTGYESVLFTLQDGHLVGWFGEPGGPKYLVHWVFAASATDQGFLIQVTDTETDETWTYSKQPGEPAPAVTDTDAFPDACRP